MSDMPPGLKLDLADGQRWLIRPVDDKAAALVAELGKVMRLCRGQAGQELYVAVSSESGESARSGPEGNAAVVCRLADAQRGSQASPSNRDVQIAHMGRIAFLIARGATARGGLLLHAALAEHRGSGFILAGPSGVGKSTASARLPPAWRSLCDDTTLVVRDRTGRWWAHPWPTWSLFFLGGPGGSWAVENAVPLRAVFFLVQSPSDRLEPLNATQATALTLESVVDIVRETHRATGGEAARTLCGDCVRAARALASAVPAYLLRLSLHGRFWEEIERVLPLGDAPGSGFAEDSREHGPVSVGSLLAGDSMRVVYTGTSMNPTLVEPELLEVEPYGRTQVRPGDVVCFKSPGTDTTIVHRAVAVGRDGIRTRGDNCAGDDPWVLQAGALIGRVRAAQRGTRRRVVHSGWQGPAVLRCARLSQSTRRNAGRLPGALYRFLAGLGPFDRLLPQSLRPRLVRFDARYRVFVKLLVGRQTVGQYDERIDRWRIRRPFHLFVDEQSLAKARALVFSGQAQD